MKTARILSLTVALFIGALGLALAAPTSTPKEGAIRVLFLGHESEHHNSNKYYPMLSKALGRDAIYFDYVTSVEEALGDAAYLSKFDAVLLYANHGEISPQQWKNLKGYVEGGFGAGTKVTVIRSLLTESSSLFRAVDAIPSANQS